MIYPLLNYSVQTQASLLYANEMKSVNKALAAVIRQQDGKPELLVFRHPFAGIQLPKGTVETNESIEQATLRELSEESGISLSDQQDVVGTCESFVRGGPKEDGPLEKHIWSITIFFVDQELPDKWRHKVEGEGLEKGMLFEYFWLSIDASLPSKLHEYFRPSAKIILNNLSK